MKSPAPTAIGNGAGIHIEAGKLDTGKATDTPGELQDLARAVRRIGSGFRCDPETIAIAKDEIAHRLNGIARRLAGAA
jgi:hypothetical protein